MKITYDPYADAAYIYFETHPRLAKCVSRTVQVSEDVAVDLAVPDGEEPVEKVIGIEVLSAGENLGLSTETRQLRLEILGKPVRSK